LAVALAKEKRLEIAGDRTIRILDYQVPLKAAQFDKGIGKIDLSGCGPDGRLEVIELKVGRSAGVVGETPLRALLEGLAYAVSFVDLGDVGVKPGLDGNAPQLTGDLRPTVLSL